MLEHVKDTERVQSSHWNTQRFVPYISEDVHKPCRAIESIPDINILREIPVAWPQGFTGNARTFRPTKKRRIPMA